MMIDPPLPQQSPGMEATLHFLLPEVFRLSAGLCGRRDVADEVTRFVLSRAVRMMPRFADEFDAARWAQRHTVLTSRRVARFEPEPAGDVLAAVNPDSTDTAQIAFVRAFRMLSPQQREAIVLTEFERMDPRQTAVTMDCSTEAAANHLAAAMESLGKLFPDSLAAQLERMSRDFHALSPPAELVVPILRAAEAQKRRRWIMGAAAIALGGVIIVVIIAFVIRRMR